MSQNLEVGVKITADGKGLATEARAAKDALNQLGETAKRANTEAASAAERFTANLKRQSDTLGMTSAQVRAYDAAQMEMTQAQRASVEASNRAITSYENQQIALDDLRTRAAAAGVAVGAALVAGLKASITAAGQAEQSHLRLAAVLNGTRHAAGLTKADLDEMADSMKDKLGIDDDALRDSMAVLLTFRNVSRDSFGEALETSANLAAVMQTDLKSAVLQLGKALENPDEGLTALKRSGVSFSETQKDMIKDLVETGNQAEAITLILKTMKEQGLDGVAESMNQGITKASRDASMAWDDLLKAIGSTDTVKSGVDIVLGSWTGYLKDMRQVIESGDWVDRLAFFTIGLKTPSMIAKSNAPAAAADPAQQALADEGLARQKADQQAEIAAIAKKKADEEAAKAAEEASKRAIAAARAREEAERRAYQQSVDGANRTIAALKLETEQIGLNAIQKKMLVAATEAAKAPTEELAQEIMASAQAWALATQRQEELMAAEKDRLEGIKAVEKAEQDAARAAEESARQAQQQWNQLWGGVEQTAKTAFVQFAAHGKSAIQSIGESIKLAIIDVLYQLTVRKWIINIGASLSGVLGSGVASAAGAGNILSSGSNLLSGGLNIGSLIGRGASALGFSSFGAGASGAASAGVFGAGGLNYLGGAGTALGAGAEFGAMTSMGASLASGFAAATGPALIAFAATQGLKMLAGDKRLGGGFGNFINKIGDIPILGDLLPVIPLINALFGRGPLKQKETSLTGSIGLDGFESGMLQARFEAKGGLFRSNKTDFARVDAITGDVWTDNQKQLGAFAEGLSKASKEIFGAFNDTAKQTSETLKQVGKDLGLSNDALAGFSYQINLVSEKGKMLTEEQIGKEIENMTDAMARKLLPTVDEFSKRGETALQTVARLGTEFTTLVSAAALVLGKSSADAKSMISGSTYQGRTAFVDAAGGLDALNQQVAFFADNFLTESERLAPVQEQLNSELKRLGLSSDLTRDQYRDLVQSFGKVNGISEDTLHALLNLQGAFVTVTNAAEAAANKMSAEKYGLETRLLQLQGNTVELRRRELELIDPSNQGLQKRIWAIEDENAAVAAASDARRKIVDNEKKKITDDYNVALKDVSASIDTIAKSVGELKTLSDALKATVSQIRPMSRDAAKQQLQGAIAVARSGGALPDADSLREALGALGKSAPGFSGSFDYAREQAKTANLVESLGKMADDQLTLGNRSMSALVEKRDRLTANFEKKIALLDNSLVNDNVPQFAKGGFHRGGLRIVGENGPELESTGPARITSNNDMTKLLSNEDVVEQLALLLKELQKNSEINDRVVNKLDAVTQGGTALRTKQVA